MHHVWGIVGLGINMAASVMLLWFPPKVEAYTSDGLYVPDGGPFAELPVSGEGRRQNIRQYRIRREGFRFAFALLFLGFLLQLLDLLIG
jgi:hypothetical protein